MAPLSVIFGTIPANLQFHKDNLAMSEAFRDRPRPPLRETVCDIDRDILRLVMRRSAFIKKMQGDHDSLAPWEEKRIRESWENHVAKVSSDPKLFSRLYALMREVEFHE